MSFTIEPIGYLSSPYQEKFAIPRQPNLVPQAKGRITLSKEFNNLDCVRDLDEFSHIWLQFVFHQTREQGWKPTVRPPRLGGNKRMGVFATRSTFRPNALGLSVVNYHSAEMIDGKVVLNISGMDLLDKTPIVDIKPYIPYVDSVADAQAGFAKQKPQALLSVEFSSLAEQQLKQYFKNEEQEKEFKLLLVAVLSQDPRPAYKQGKLDYKIYAVKLAGFDVRWKVEHRENCITVIALQSQIVII